MNLPETCPTCHRAERNSPASIRRSLEHDVETWQAEAARLAARVAELEARCKLLELAGDNLDLSIACGCGFDGPCQMCRRASDSWKQAKEAKP